MSFTDMKSVAMLAVVACFVASVAAFPSGAPEAQCTAQMPSHSAAAQNGQSPYMIVVGGDTYYTAGGMKMITVKGMNSEMLRGLTCQVRMATDVTVAVGTFKLMEAEANLKTLACDGVAYTAITHTNRADKPMAQFYWMAPATDVGAVKVMCTVVQTFDTFWMAVLSDQLTYHANPPTTTTTTTTTTVMPAEMDNGATLATGSIMMFALSAIVALFSKSF